MTRRDFLSSSPIFAAAGFVAFWFLAMLWNWAIDPLNPKLKIRSADSLAGVEKPKPAPLSIETLWSGQAQKIYSANFGRMLPPLVLAVRAKNQFLYSLLGVAGSNGIIIGENGQLFELPYVDEYCGRGAPPDVKRIEFWADSIREIQDRVEKAGKAFVYLITPSKAAQYSEYLPAKMNCQARANGATDKLSPFRAALDARAIRYVDAASLIHAAKPHYSIDLFPRGGTHWNMLGAAIGAQQVIRVLDDAKRVSSPLGPFEFTYDVDKEARLSDRDLLDLLNLLWPDPHYPAPIVNVSRSGAACAGAPHVIEMGGSFMHGINFLWERAACAPLVEHWFYFRRGDGFGVWRLDIPAGDTSVYAGRPMPTNLADVPESIRRADIIFLEENESVISAMKQVEDLRNAAATLK
jgi:alginate O-acetyltransferase complex protein AlgJ